MAERGTPATGPHPARPELATGEVHARVRAAAVLLHVRRGTAQDRLALAARLEHPGAAFLDLQAAKNSWYRYSFLAPVADNEPALSSALAAVGEAFDRLAVAGIPSEPTMLVRFSEGARLALEGAARHARRSGGAVGRMCRLEGRSR